MTPYKVQMNERLILASDIDMSYVSEWAFVSDPAFPRGMVFWEALKLTPSRYYDTRLQFGVSMLVAPFASNHTVPFDTIANPS